jgi:hypothetical protein
MIKASALAMKSHASIPGIWLQVCAVLCVAAGRLLAAVGVEAAAATVCAAAVTQQQ